jgi:UDP-glucose 4-epimerase
MSADRRNWSDQLVVVTGGLGFLGSNLVHHLHGRGARVRVIDALVDGHGGDRRNVPADVEVVVAAVGDPACAAVLDGADVVFNLAGQVSHVASMRDPLADLEWNTLTHARFLEQLRTHAPTARIVHASTRQVYGRPIRSLVDEDHPVNPVDVNGVAKFAGEQLHLVYARAYDMSTISLRFTNLYGPRQRLTSDELGVLPVFIRKALRGDDIALFGDGSQRRDCLFVDDAVAALCCAASTNVSAVVDVGAYRDRTHCTHRRSRRHHGERRHDHLVPGANAECGECKLQRASTRRHRHCVGGTDGCGERGFPSFGPRAEQPVAGAGDRCGPLGECIGKAVAKAAQIDDRYHGCSR